MSGKRTKASSATAKPKAKATKTKAATGSETTGKGKGKAAMDAGTKTKTKAAEDAETGVDRKLDAYHEYAEKAAKALIGYARIDIIKRRLVFGKYNARDLNNREKSLLLDSFVNNGLDRYSFANVINVIVDPEAVVEGTVKPQIQLPPGQRDGSHLPWLQMKDDGPDDEGMADDGTFGPAIVAAGGRHRRAALADWVKAKKTAMHAADRHLKELRTRAKNPADDELVTEDMVVKAESDAGYIRGLVNTGGAWVVAVYDLSESLFLSFSQSRRTDGRTDDDPPPQPRSMRVLDCISRRTSAPTPTQRPPRRASSKCSRRCASTGRNGTNSSWTRTRSRTRPRTRSDSSSVRTTCSACWRSSSTTPSTTTRTRTCSRSRRSPRTCCPFTVG